MDAGVATEVHVSRLRVACTADLGYGPPSMDRIGTRIVLAMLATLALGQLCAGCGDAPAAPLGPVPTAHVEASWTVSDAPAPARAEPVEPPPPGWLPHPLDVPDRCNRLTVRATKQGPVFGKVLPDWIRSESDRAREQHRIRLLIQLVATEMGAGPVEAEMLWRMAIRESSGNAQAIHVLGPDTEANERASRGGRTKAERWAKAPVAAYEERRGELERAGFVDGWAIGRGLYGMNTALFMPRWSTEAPPWAMCDPIVATVTAIWAMRAGLRECGGSTLRDAHRRFASGRCAMREPERERAFDRLARGRVRGLRLDAFDPDQRASLGRAWPQAETDRAELYGLLHGRAAALGLVDP